MIYLLRHGLDDERYIGGFSDVSLIEEGKKQVEKTAKKIKKENIYIAKIISSDIKRAVESASVVSKYLLIPDIEVSEFLREQSKRLLNGMLKSEAMEKYPEYFQDVTPKTVYPDGESLEYLYNRIKNNLEYFANLEDATLIVTHRGVINMLYYILNDIPLDMDKNKFGVTHASLHEYDQKNKVIRKVL